MWSACECFWCKTTSRSKAVCVNHALSYIFLKTVDRVWNLKMVYIASEEMLNDYK